jgi:hypothetical protein
MRPTTEGHEMTLRYHGEATVTAEGKPKRAVLVGTPKNGRPMTIIHQTVDGLSWSMMLRWPDEGEAIDPSELEPVWGRGPRTGWEGD